MADYYETVGASGGPGAGIESRFARVERCVKASVEHLSARESVPVALGRDFLWFLATLCVRTPWARSAVEDHLAVHPGQLDHLSDSDRWAASIEYLATWADEYFSRMDWVRCGPIEAEDFFITSDCPVVLTGDNMNGSVLDVLRLTEESSLVSVPVSARVALVGSYDKATVFQTGVTTVQINDRTFDHAKRFVYSPKELHWTA